MEGIQVVNQIDCNRSIGQILNFVKQNDHCMGFGEQAESENAYWPLDRCISHAVCRLIE